MIVVGQHKNVFLLQDEDGAVRILHQVEGKNRLFPPYRRADIHGPSYWNEPTTDKTADELLAEFPVEYK